MRVGIAWCELADPLVRARVEGAGALVPNCALIEFPFPEGTLPVFMREIADVHRDLYAEYGELYGENIRPKIERCIAVTDAEAAAATAARADYERQALEALDGLDLLLTPTLAFVPPPADVDELAVREASSASRTRSTCSAGPRWRCRAGRPRTGCRRRSRSSGAPATTPSCSQPRVVSKPLSRPRPRLPTNNVCPALPS